MKTTAHPKISELPEELTLRIDRMISYFDISANFEIAHSKSVQDQISLNRFVFLATAAALREFVDLSDHARQLNIEYDVIREAINARRRERKLEREERTRR